MPLLPSDVLTDPRYRMPAVAPGAHGLAWLRASVPRFCDGDLHLRRRQLVEEVIAGLSPAPAPGADPTVVLLQALGLPPGCADDVALVAAAYHPHLPGSAAVDAAVERLVTACGPRDERTAARICVLVQAHGATRALAAALASARPGDRIGPPVPITRRVDPDGRPVEVDLTDAAFGRGPHTCPGAAIGELLAGAAAS